MKERGIGEAAQVFVIVFLCILLVNSIRHQSGPLSIGFFPSVLDEDDPLEITAKLMNPESEPQTYRVTMFVDGVQVLAVESTLEASSIESFTSVRDSPRIGSALRVYAEALNLQTGARYDDVLLIPQSPPEVWLSFSSFSSFSSSLAAASSASMIPYLSTPVNVGLWISIVLIGLLVFRELSDPSYSKTGTRLMQLRSRYGWLAVSLLLIFSGMVFTRIVMIIAG